MNYRRATNIFSVILIALAGLPVALFASPVPRHLDTILQDALAAEGMTGIEWSVVDGGEIKTGARGVATASAARPLSPENRVHVGSIAKTVLALGILRLVTEGRISLDDPVENILPGVQFDNRWHRSRPVLLRHLLDHSSGLEDVRLWHIFSSRIGQDDKLAALFANGRTELKVRTKPGKIFSYSNIGYSLLGMTIERVTTMRYETWLDRNILMPIGMRDSTASFTTQQGPGRDSRLAWGHLDNGQTVAAMAVAVRPAGQFTTTAFDMARLAQFLMGDGTANGVRIIQQNLLTEMARPQHSAAKAGLVDGYSLGLGTFDRAGQLGRCHGGDVVGFRAMLCIYPEHKKAYFRSINIDREGADYRRFDDILITSLDLPPTPLPAPTPLASSYQDWKGRFVPLVSRVSIGRYGDLLSDGFEFELTDTGATIRQDDGKAVRLLHAGRTLFRADNKVRRSLVVHTGIDGTKLLSTDFRTFRKAHPAERLGLIFGLGAGMAGLAYLLFATPLIAWRQKRRVLTPALAVFGLFPVAGIALYYQPFQQLGDLTTGSASLAFVTAVLPIAIVWQGFNAFRSEHNGRRLEILACVAALQWLLTLALFGAVPLILWN